MLLFKTKPLKNNIEQPFLVPDPQKLRIQEYAFEEYSLKVHKSIIQIICRTLPWSPHSRNLQSSLYSRMFLWFHHSAEQRVIKAPLAVQPGFNGIQKPPPAHALPATRNSRLDTSFCPSGTTSLLLVIWQNCNRRTCSTITSFPIRIIWNQFRNREILKYFWKLVVLQGYILISRKGPFCICTVLSEINKP